MSCKFKSSIISLFDFYPLETKWLVDHNLACGCYNNTTVGEVHTSRQLLKMMCAIQALITPAVPTPEQTKTVLSIMDELIV